MAAAERGGDPGQVGDELGHREAALPRAPGMLCA
jgi:hypothetical protein